MTTPTPTSDLGQALAAEVPAGLPDTAALARWANELFSAVPASGAGAAPGVPAAMTALPAAPAAALPGAPVGMTAPPNRRTQGNPAAPADPVFGFASTLARLSAADLMHPALLSSLPILDANHRAPFSPASVPSPASLPISGIPSFYFLETPGTATGAAAGAGTSGRHPAFDVDTIRRDFPILQERVHGRPLVWFDNAATTQKPAVVIDRLSYFYRHENSNIHRAAHELAARATDAYEGARRQVQQFLGAASADEIIFVRGATEAINLVAHSWGRKNIGEGDEILISHLEHHANIVPWQMLAAERGAKLKVVPVDSRGQLRLDELQRLLNSRTKMVSITQVSNALGTVTPVHEIVDLGHRAGACVLIDGAQSVSHLPINVQSFDADFFVLSGHKVFGPTGIGVLYGKTGRLEDMPPWQGGGNMIEDVTFERSTYQPPPGRFEAGTGNIADAVGLGAALEYLTTIGMPNIEHYETELLGYATERLASVPGLEIVGTAAHKASVLSFVIDGIEPTVIGTALNQEGIAVRAGHHCAQPILRRFGHEATVRASLAFYNTCAEVDAMAAVLRSLTASSTRRGATRSDHHHR
jgi:cysteine desulfurase/selenocysteine lyase